VRVAIERALSVIDLRAVCASPEDYANAIEPSSVSGGKIAQVIVGLVCGTGIAPGTRIHANHRLVTLVVRQTRFRGTPAYFWRGAG